MMMLIMLVMLTIMLMSLLIDGVDDDVINVDDAGDVDDHAEDDEFIYGVDGDVDKVDDNVNNF